MAALAIVIFAIIVVQICGREDVKTPTSLATPGGPTATLGPTFTPGPSPTPGPRTVTPTGQAPAGDANQRDAKRAQDIAAIQAALAQYFQKHTNYPTTNGNVQSLCVFRDSDAGCHLEEFLTPLPQDPLGNPAANGYFYASTGTAYTLYANREGGQLPECAEHPDHLRDIKSLYCVKGP